MRRFHTLPLIVLTLLVGVPCSAVTVTVDPAAYAAGTDLTNAFVGLDMRVLTNNPASPTTYNPVSSPLLVEPCTYAPCVSAGETFSLGGTMGNGDIYEGCYRRSQLGLPSSDCGMFFRVLELNFADAIDAISVDSVWSIDPPHLLAYDSLGSLVVSCRTAGPGNPSTAPGSPAGCFTYTQFGPGGDFEGTATLALEGLGITRVVFSGWAGASTATGFSYSVPEPGTLAMLLLGLAGLGASARARRRVLAIH